MKQNLRSNLRKDDRILSQGEILKLPPVQQHEYIMQMVEVAGTEGRVAKVLRLDPKFVRRRIILLTGVCNEVVSLLSNQKFSPKVFELLRKMVPKRQVEVTSLLIASGHISQEFTTAMLAATERDDWTKPHLAKKGVPLEKAEMQLMECEMRALLPRFLSVHDSMADVMIGLHPVPKTPSLVF